jgi:hypothetical protein
MAATAQYTCANRGCGCAFTARIADRKRGWARYCSKSCKAVQQERRTGAYRAFCDRQARTNGDEGLFTDAHLFSNEEHDCNKDW